MNYGEVSVLWVASIDPCRQGLLVHIAKLEAEAEDFCMLVLLLMLSDDGHDPWL